MPGSRPMPMNRAASVADAPVSHSPESQPTPASVEATEARRRRR